MKDIKISKAINIIITALSVIGFAIYLYMFVYGIVVEAYKRDYLYTAVHSPSLLIITILLSVVLPTLLCLGCWLSLKLKKLLSRIIVATICVLLLALWVIPNIVIIGFGGGIASYTENFDNYCKFDKSVNNTIGTYISDVFFPDKENLNANSRYCYYYDYGMLDEFYHIQLVTQIDDPNELYSEKVRISDIGMISFSENTYYLFHNTHTNAESSANNETGELCTAVVHFDNTKQQIMYFVFRSESQKYALESVSQIDINAGDGSLC